MDFTNIRPTQIKDIYGQNHIKKLLLKYENSGFNSLIFYGPPGVGKSLVAEILMKSANKPQLKYNATNTSVNDIKKAISKYQDSGCVIYLDEIHYFNKKQQDTLLEATESKVVTLIGATTENPYHALNDAIISRCNILEFRKLSPDDIYSNMSNIINSLTEPHNRPSNEVLYFISNIASGDMRYALKELEMLYNAFDDITQLTIKEIKEFMPRAHMSGFDKNGDNHYAYVSALQKSIRGSDPDAAIFWLSKLLEGGDIMSPSRRLLVIASEDIGLAHPTAIQTTLACVETAERLGLPEAYYPLAHATLLLATSPKSNSIGKAFYSAVEDIKNGLGAITPPHLRNAHVKGYKYAHDYPHHYVTQQYLPDDLKSKKYYEPGTNHTEQSVNKYWNKIKGE